MYSLKSLYHIIIQHNPIYTVQYTSTTIKLSDCIKVLRYYTSCTYCSENMSEHRVDNKPTLSRSWNACSLVILSLDSKQSRANFC